MRGFSGDIEKLTLENENFRKVIYTAENSQLVVMSLQPNEEIGMEVHDENDQFIRIESGEGEVIIDGTSHKIFEDYAIIVPAGAEHNVINTSSAEPLKLYTVYSPPHHIDGIIHKTKAEAESDDEEFEGTTTE